MAADKKLTQDQQQVADLSQVVDEVHQMLLRFERKMAVGHIVMIGCFATAVGLLVAMTVGIWRR